MHGAAARFLPDAHRSLLGQRLPGGWDWEWVIQEDGESAEVRAAVPDEPRVSFRPGRPGRGAGPGVARTLALGRTRGELVKVLDADDLLAPGALARDIAVFEAHAGVAWATCRVLDLLPDGSTVGSELDPPEGVIERGAVLARWKAHGFRAPVHPASLCVRRDTLLALGGWMALPASEDTGLLLALSAVSPGWFTAETGLFYRKWPGQSTNQHAHTDEPERCARMAVIEARARVLGCLFLPAHTR